MEREEPEPPVVRPETAHLDRQAEPLGDGVERDQLHPPGIVITDSADLPSPLAQYRDAYRAWLLGLPGARRPSLPDSVLVGGPGLPVVPHDSRHEDRP